jgi:lipopolysaccharide biosynthesis regulator YciM
MSLLNDDDVVVTFGGSIHWGEDYRCASCGYGASRREPPDACPMCKRRAWRSRSKASSPTAPAAMVMGRTHV